MDGSNNLDPKRQLAGAKLLSRALGLLRRLKPSLGSSAGRQLSAGLTSWASSAHLAQLQQSRAKVAGGRAGQLGSK